MIDLTLLGNTTGDPALNTVAAKNAASPTAIDGTPYVKDKVDNEWGWMQAILDYAGEVADGIGEDVTASQLLQAQINTLSPPGFILPNCWNDDPITLGFRCLDLDGSGILVADYNDLVAVTYVGDGNNATVKAGGGAFYKADDAVGTNPNDAGIYFILPNGIGQALRSLDISGTIDPGGASRFLGDIQPEDVMKHFHSGLLDNSASNSYEGQVISYTAGGVNATVATLQTGIPASSPIFTDDDLEGGLGVETRMTNMSVNYAIRY